MKNVWKKVSEQLPYKSCEVIIATDFGHITDVRYSSRHKLFNAFDRDSEKEAHLHCIDALYWAYPEDVLPDDCLRKHYV